MKFNNVSAKMACKKESAGNPMLISLNTLANGKEENSMVSEGSFLSGM